MVHAKTFAPNPKPIIDVVGESEFVIVPLPDTIVQAPTPTIALLAAIVVVLEEIQSVCVDPAFAKVGVSFTIIATVEDEDAQGEFEMVHAKTFVPNPKPVTPVFGKDGFIIVPLPETNVHIPVPTVAEFALMMVFGEEMQIV